MKTKGKKIRHSHTGNKKSPMHNVGQRQSVRLPAAHTEEEGKPNKDAYGGDDKRGPLEESDEENEAS